MDMQILFQHANVQREKAGILKESQHIDFTDFHYRWLKSSAWLSHMRVCYFHHEIDQKINKLYSKNIFFACIILMNAPTALTHSTYNLVREFLDRLRSEDESIFRQQLRRLEANVDGNVPLQECLQVSIRD